MPSNQFNVDLTDLPDQGEVQPSSGLSIDLAGLPDKSENTATLSQWKPSLWHKTRMAGREFKRGIEQTILSAPQAIGGLMTEMGERAEEGPAWWEWIPGGGAYGLSKMVSSRQAQKFDYDERLAEKGRKIVAENKQSMKEYADAENWLDPAEKKRYEDFLNKLGSGATTLGLALGLSMATKNPAAVASAFGLYQKGNVYSEAREAGLEPRQAGMASTAAGAVEGALEYIGLEFMLSKFGTGIVRDAIIRSASEGLQEGSQQLGENIITKVAGIRDIDDIFEGVGESALIGVVLGGPASVSVSVAERTGVIEELKSRGLTEAEARQVTNYVISKQRETAERVVEEQIKEQMQPGQAKPEMYVKDPLSGKNLIIVNSENIQGDRIDPATIKPPELAQAELGDQETFLNNMRSLQAYTSDLLRAENQDRADQGIEITNEEKKAQRFVLDNYLKARANFIDESLNEFGVETAVGADIGKYANPEMKPERSVDFHEAGSALSKSRYAELLQDQTTRENPVLIMAGGAGAGKTSSLTELKYDLLQYSAINDTNLNAMGSAIKKIEQALQTGRKVQIAYVHRDVIEAFRNGVIPRVRSKGRIVTIKSHADTHYGAREVIDKLVERYKDNPNVEIEFIDNSRGKGEQTPTTQDKVPYIKETREQLEDKLLKEVRNARAEGRLTDKEVELFKKGTERFEDLQEVQPVAERKPRKKKTVSKETTKKEKTTPSKKAEKKVEKLKEAKKKGAKQEMTRRAELTQAKQTLKDIRQGVREGRYATLEATKKVQEKLIKTVKAAVKGKDQAKFLTTIKNINTQEKLEKNLPDIKTRLDKLSDAAERDASLNQIKKELKETKPTGTGTQKKAKFEYNTNKVFDKLRAYNSMTKKEASEALDNLAEAKSPLAVIERRFLEMKAFGKQASPALYEQVLNDIVQIKEMGRAVKDDAELMLKINRQDAVDTVNEAIKASRFANANQFIKAMSRLYTEGIANMYSLINAVSNAKIADKYNTELAEMKRFTETFKRTQKMSDDVEKIYGKRAELVKEDMLAADTVTMIEDNGRKEEFTKDRVMTMYAFSQNPTLRARLDNFYGPEQVDSALATLSDKDKQLADYYMETVQGYWDVFNQFNIEQKGMDIGRSENYFPTSSEYTQDIFDDMIQQGEIPKYMKARSTSEILIPKIGSIFDITNRYIAQAEHVKHISRKYEDLQRIFTNRDVRNSITDRFGDSTYKAMMGLIENLSLNKYSEQSDYIANAFGRVMNNWVSAKVGLNTSTLIRQLGSMSNYAENMNAVEWVNRFTKAISAPKTTFDYMWKNSPYLQARFKKGYSEALNRALTESAKINRYWGNYTQVISSFARSGDIAAIVYGGYPYVQSQIEQGVDKKTAFENFEKATLRSQQSPLTSSLSRLQNSKNAFSRFFLPFKNTPSQYARKLADSTIKFYNGEISAADYAKTQFIYGVVQPTIYVMSGLANKKALLAIGALLMGKKLTEDKDKETSLLKQILTQMVVNPILAVPLLSDATEYGMRKLLGMKTYDFGSIPLYDDLRRAGRKTKKKKKNIKDYMDIASAVVEPTTGLPVGVFSRYIDKLFLNRDQNRTMEEQIEHQLNKIDFDKIVGDIGN